MLDKLFSLSRATKIAFQYFPGTWHGEHGQPIDSGRLRFWETSLEGVMHGAFDSPDSLCLWQKKHSNEQPVLSDLSGLSRVPSHGAVGRVLLPLYVKLAPPLLYRIIHVCMDCRHSSLTVHTCIIWWRY